MRKRFCAQNSAPKRVPAKRILLDTGPLAALFNRADRAHGRAKAWFESSTALMVTTEAVVTQLSYLLEDNTALQTVALLWVEQARRHGRLQIHPVEDHAVLALLLERYDDLPCDYADATLIALANSLDIREVATLDQRDFSIYRLNRNHSFKLIFPAAQ